MYICSMKQNVKIIQSQIQIDFDINKCYLVVTEIIDDHPTCSYHVKMPNLAKNDFNQEHIYYLYNSN